ncbi:NAD(P)H-dependent oxidoreductase [Brevibacterium jeotgali]|uniref:NADPH-dependent FMN reductase n=1 Tax=Brevibacterium jeotgali TaxID=1262550 RepID=A0A2H1L1B4_9MICO|nr:NAD(P)H-dependent oxidoreductase [Brevibacterium jeotgali]TWC01987.1 NADPH-dependent FMN reductase [Brevibacterium jeotgali]SMY10662.1 NADPH-dependent FMN reductase [Brevibacterium jeotgali]
MVRILLIHHSPTESTQKIAASALSAAKLPDLAELGELELIEVAALEPNIDQVLQADAYVLGTTANFGYISGALKHFFDTVYDHVREQTAGRPFSYWIHGGYDTTGAEKAMEALTTGIGWKLSHDPVVWTGAVEDSHLEQVQEMTATVMASALE